MWIIASIIVIIAIYYFLSSNFQYWKKRNVPYPPPSFLFGNIGSSLIFKKSIGQIFSDVYNDFPEYLYVGYYKIRKPGIILRDPQLIRDVLIADFNKFHDNDVLVNEESDPICARSPFVLKGEQWKIVKNQVIPCFTPKKVKEMYVLVEDAAKKLVNYLEEEQEATKPDGLEMRELFTKYTTEVVASCAFGLEGKTFTEPDSIFIKMVKKIFEPSLSTVIGMYILLLAPSLTKLLKVGIISKPVCDYFLGIVRTTIKYRKDNKIVRNDFLDFITDLENKSSKYKITDLDITAHAVSFFIGGLETTAALASYTCHELATNPKILKQLRDEIDKALVQNNGKLDFDSIVELKYLDAVINESLRMHPPAIFLQRMCTQTYKFPPPQGPGTGNEVEVEVGTPIIIPIYGLHYDPQYFKDPHVFNPDRFLPKNKDAIINGTFLPFGEGGRSCHGQRFALMQAKVVIVHVLLNYDIEVSRKTILPLQIDPKYFVQHVKGGLWLNFYKKQQQKYSND